VFVKGRKTHCGAGWFALYLEAMEPFEPLRKPESAAVVAANSDAEREEVSRRKFGAKLLYVPPAVLAVIDATQRPALASSSSVSPE
jgi:hypothetical protein